MANLLKRRNEPGATSSPWHAPADLVREVLGWDPFAEMRPLARARDEFVPDFEVKETKDGYVFRADVPGIREEDLDISLAGNRLTVSGKRDAEEHREGETWYAYERQYGSFSRSFTLPDDVDTDRAQADLRQGVLTLVVPRKPEVKPRKIAVHASPGGKAQA